MIIQLKKQAGIKLLTKGKFCADDITIQPKLQNKTVTANGTVTPDSGFVGLASVSINVPTGGGTAAPVLQEKATTVSANGTVELAPDSGYDGLSKATVTVSVPNVIPDGYIIPTEELVISANGEYDVTNCKKIIVNVPIPPMYDGSFTKE